MKPLLSVAFLFALCMGAFGMAAGLDLPDALKKADIIARIRIVDAPNPDPAKAEGTADLGEVQSYRRLARAQIIESVKGLPAGTIIEIEHDNGFICPNIIYSKGDDCIVFAQKRPNGHFETMNTYAGCFKVERGVVSDCYLFFKHPKLGQNAKPEDILAELRLRLPKQP